jgi:Bacterial PH domain
VKPIEYRLSQRRQFLRRGWIATVVFLIGVAGVAVAPEVSGNATGFLVIPGLAGLGVAIISFNVAHGRTVLSPRGIRTGTFFGRHSCPWPEVAEIESVNFSVSRYSLPTEVPEGHGQAQIRIRRSSGKSFRLAAPRDLNGPDPQLKEKFLQIRDYWANAQGQIQTSGH